MAYGNGGMQESRDNPTMPMAVGGNPATGPGGNKTLINQDEAKILDTTIEDAPFRSGDLSMEDDSHVMGVYKMMASDFAGS